jgi:D-hydroxyproline dehydrogenase subunit beta
MPGALMSDLGLVRYAGYAALAEAAPLRARLEAEQGEHLKHGIHLIVVQSAEGSLILHDVHRCPNVRRTHRDDYQRFGRIDRIRDW